MPPSRIDKDKFSYVPSNVNGARDALKIIGESDANDFAAGKELEITDLSICSSPLERHSGTDMTTTVVLGDMTYPLTSSQRSSFRTAAGKVRPPPPLLRSGVLTTMQRVTAHQWAVYDFTRKIPCGRVTTYKHLCRSIGEGSPRSGKPYA